MTFFTFSNLLKACYQCRKNKRRTANAAKFELVFEKELILLEKQLQSHSYRPGRSICFAITDPKLREIFAADFRDRIVHHLLVNYLETIFEPKFVNNSFACRKGKGAIKAVKYLQKTICAKTNYRCANLFYMHIDVSAFFTSLDRFILFKIIKKYVKNQEIIWLTEAILTHDPTKNYYAKGDLKSLSDVPAHKTLFSAPTNIGLPIGNLTSQFFANVYMNELDQFAKHTLGIKHYLRYVDDIVMLSNDKNELIFWRNQINSFLKEQLELKLQPDKEILQPVSRGINFLGYIIKPDQILVRNRTVKKLKKKLYEFNRKILQNNYAHPIRNWTPELCQEFQKIFSSINSYYGLFKHADTYRLRRHLYEEHFNILKLYLVPANQKYDYFIWSND